MSSNNLVNRVSTAATQTLVASGSNEAVVVEPHLPDRHHSSPLSVATSPVGLDDEQQSSRRAAYVWIS